MGRKKKLFMYLAFDENNHVILEEDGKPVISLPTFEDKKPNWGNKLHNYSEEKVKIREEYKEEVRGVGNKQKNEEDCRKKLFNKAQKLISNKKIEKVKIDISEEKQDKERSLTKNKGIEVTVKTVVKNNHMEKKEENLVNKSNEYIQIQNSILEAKESIIEKSDKDLDLVLEDMEKIDDQLKKGLEELEKLERNLKNISCQEDTIKETIERTDLSTQKTIIPYIDKIANQIKSNKKDLLSKQKSIDEELEELRDSTQTIEGKLLKQLDEITTLLISKDIKITREFPPICEEEKEIRDLVMYSNKISEQLGYAARELIRKKAVFENQNQSIVNEQKIVKQREEKAFDDGKLFVIKQLLSKYTDIDIIINAEDNHLHCVWTFLKEIGVEIDGDGYYQKGNELDLKEADMESMAAKYTRINGAGRYRVIKTGLKFKKEVVFVAEFEKITEKPTKEMEEKETENTLITV